MRFTSLSDNPNSPCSVLQFKQATIMLGTNFTVSLSYRIVFFPSFPSKRDAASYQTACGFRFLYNAMLQIRITLMRIRIPLFTWILLVWSGSYFSLGCGSCSSSNKLCESATTALVYRDPPRLHFEPFTSPQLPNLRIRIWLSTLMLTLICGFRSDSDPDPDSSKWYESGSVTLV